jgi:hypothetical protein
MADEFKQHGYNPTTKQLGTCMAKMAAVCTPEVKSVMPQWAKKIDANNQKTKKVKLN